MSFIGSWFKRDQSENIPSVDFSHWMHPEAIDINNPWAGLIPSSSTDPAQFNPTKYGPAVVIGLGKAGEFVLRRWLDTVANDPAGKQELLAAYLITEQSVDPLPEDVIPTHQFALEEAQVSEASGITRREAAHRSFRSYSVYKPFSDNLLADLSLIYQYQEKTIRVVIVTALSEAEIGIVGDIAQIVRETYQTGHHTRPEITLFFSLTAPENIDPISEVDQYAVLRETWRFSKQNGMNWMPALPEKSDQMIQSELYDRVFLIGSQTNEPESGEGPFSGFCGPALLEALALLINPLSEENDIWRLDNKRWASFSICSLYIPINQLHAYFAARMAKAVLYGEHPDRKYEGLLPNENAEFFAEGQKIARRWFSYSPHPLFDWLLSLNSVEQARYLPKLNDGHKQLFQSVIARGVLEILNEKGGQWKFSQAIAGLEWIKQFIERIQKLVTQSNSNYDDRLLFQGFLSSFLKLTEQVLCQVKSWKEVVGVNKGAAPLGNLFDVISDCQKSSGKELKDSTGGAITKSVIGLKEADEFYVRSIRPELEKNISSVSEVLKRVQERIGWWMDLTLNEGPRLVFVCIPQNENGGEGAPPEVCTYFPSQVTQISRAVMDICRQEMKGYNQQFLTFAKGSSFARNARSLNMASRKFLAFDTDLAIRQSIQISQKACLVGGGDIGEIARYRGDAFPEIPESNIQTVGAGSPNRMTAVQIYDGISFEVITFAKETYNSYAHQGWLHFYPQEKNATLYERRIHQLFDGLSPKKCLLPADLTMTLYDARLVSTFCQALFAGLISPQHGRYFNQDYETYWWTVKPVGKYPQLPLVKIDHAPETCLWEAYQRFIVALPFDQKAQQSEPLHPFNRANVNDYLKQLIGAVKAAQQEDDLKEKLLTQYYSYARNENDIRKGFADLLKVESQNPVWKDWNKER